MKTKPTKYTEEFVEKELESMLQLLLKDEDILLIGELLERKGYPLQYLSRWEKKYGEDNKKINETTKRLRRISELRIAKGMLKNKLNVTASIFCLKNNYGWTDKQEVTRKGDSDKQIVVVNNEDKDAERRNKEYKR